MVSACTLVASSSRSRSRLQNIGQCLRNQHYQASPAPYGRTHVWKRRPPVLPNPIVPHFPQKVIRSDGSTFVHWTTSPKSVFRLTRDLTNNPMWNVEMLRTEGAAEESETSGRLGRFQRRFGGGGSQDTAEIDWNEDWSALTGMEAPEAEAAGNTSKK